MDCDAASLTDIDKLAERVKSGFGMLDLLFVNAGITCFMLFDSMTETAYDELLSINTKSAYFTFQKLAPLMTEGSAVVFTTSVANVKGLPEISAYSARRRFAR